MQASDSCDSQRSTTSSAVASASDPSGLALAPDLVVTPPASVATIVRAENDGGTAVSAAAS